MLLFAPPSKPPTIRFTDTRLFLAMGLMAVICGQIGETWYAVEQEVARHRGARGAEARALLDDYAHALEAPAHPPNATAGIALDVPTKASLRGCTIVQMMGNRITRQAACAGAQTTGRVEGTLLEAVLAIPGHVAEQSRGDLVAVRHALAPTPRGEARHVVMLYDFTAVNGVIRRTAWTEGVITELLAYTLLAALAGLYAIRISRPLGRLTNALAWVDADAGCELPAIAGRGDLADLGRALTETCERLRDERRRLRDALTQLCAERDLLAATLNAIDDGLIITDLSGTVRRLNPAAERICGQAGARVLGGRLDALLPGWSPPASTGVSGRDMIDRGDGLLLAGGAANASLSMQQQPVVGADGVHRGHITLLRPSIKEPVLRRAAETASEIAVHPYHASTTEQVLRSVLDTFPDGLVWMNADGIFDGANRRFLAIAGNSEHFAAVGMSHYLMPWREQTAAFLAAAADARALGETVHFDATLPTADAGRRRMHISVAPLPDGDSVLIVFHDVEDLHAARSALVGEQERVNLILQRTGAATWDWDLTHDRVLIDERWHQHTASNTVASTPIACYADWLAKVHPDDRAIAEAAVEAVANGSRRSFECEYRMRHANGGWIWVNDLGSSVDRGADGRACRIVGLRLDISGRIERERPLRAIAKAVTQTRQGTLLEALLTAACEMSGGSGAFVAAVDVDTGQARITAGAAAGRDLVGHVYPLYGTPCGTVLGEDCCVYNGDVDRRFPRDQALRDLGVRSYAGHRLTGESGELCGIFVVFSTATFSDVGMARTMVEILAPTAALEFRREQRAAAVRRSEQRYRAIYDAMPLMLVTINDDGRIVEVNAAWERGSGYAHALIVDRPLLGCFTVESATRLERRLGAAVMSSDTSTRTYTLTTRGGDALEVACLHFSTRIADAVTHRVVVFEDVTARRQAQEELRVAATAFTEHGPMLVLDHQRRVKRVNGAFCALAQVIEGEVRGRDLRFLRTVDQQAGFYRQFWRAVTRDGRWSGELGILRGDGSARMVWMTVTAVTDDHCMQVGYVASMIDITDRVAAEREVERLACYDALTGLANRRFLAEHLHVAVAEARRYRMHGALLFIDMHNFKNVNDSMGHGMGDRVLVEIAERLRGNTRAADLVCRMGGDEFVVVLKQMGTDREASELAVRLAADKLMVELSRPYVLDDQEFHLTPTVGITLFPDAGYGADELLRNADAAMYRGKAAGRSTYRFHDPATTDAISARVQMERDLRVAVRDGALDLHYQPQLALDGTVVGAEALIRWHHHERGSVAPDEFIPVAEVSDLIHDLGDWVLHRALQAYATWQAAGLTSVGHISVNISPRQLRAPDLVERLERIRRSTGIAASHIIMELTEQSVIEDLRGTVAKMRRLREYGYRFSLDDFGIGYSSLAYLRDLPVDQLKIDRYFVRDIVHNATATALAETIITMGRHLDLVTIAEGVEDTAQARMLDLLGCRYFQGFLYCAPVAEVDFMRYCATRGGGALVAG